MDKGAEMRALLEKCAMTSLSSKLVASKKQFFAKMVVDAVLQLDELLPLNMIGKTASKLHFMIRRKNCRRIAWSLSYVPSTFRNNVIKGRC